MHHELENSKSHMRRTFRGRMLWGALLAIGLLGTAGTLPSNAAPPVGQLPTMPTIGRTAGDQWVVARAPISDPWSDHGRFCQNLRTQADNLVAEYARDGTTTARRAQIRDELNTIGINWRDTCKPLYGDIFMFRPASNNLPQASLVRAALLQR